MNYPETLISELAHYGLRPTGDADWDQSILKSLCNGNRNEAHALVKMSAIVSQATEEIVNAQKSAQNLADPEVFSAHSKLLLFIANEIILAPQRRKFIIDDDNKQVLRFLLYYFNDCPLAEEVFPGRGYKLHKNILLQGGVGVGKTMLMQIFSEYLRRIQSPRFFYNLSVTQMVNYYTIHNNLDRFTYHEEGSRGFQCKPENVCLNDIGIQDKTFFGMDTGLLTDEFLHARNEIWTQYGKCAHLTTNLDDKQLIQRFNRNDRHNRLVDRFKTYNVIPMTGKSRR